MADLHILKEPKVKATLIALGVVVALYLLTGGWLNNIRTTSTTIHNNFVSLKDNCEHRVALIPQFIQLLQYFAPGSHDLQQQLNIVYQAAKEPISESILTDKAGLQAFIAHQREVTQILSYMVLQANNTPSIAQNRQYLMLRMQLMSFDQQIDYAVVLLNQNIITFNSLITGFPKEWLNALFVGEKPKQLVQVTTSTSEAHEAK